MSRVGKISAVGSRFAAKLGEAADQTASLSELLNVKTFRDAMERLDKACEKFDKAWSGSNLGYHADVYTANLKPAPAGINFSAEWGLEDRWPVHQPSPIWEQYTTDQIIKALLDEAGVRKIEIYNADLNDVQASFEQLKDSTISALSAQLKRDDDQFLHKKLADIQGLKAVSLVDVQRALTKRVSTPIRDSLAMSQGSRIAGHQLIWATPFRAQQLGELLVALENSARSAAAHIQMQQNESNSPNTNGRSIAIGHGRSPVWRELATFLEKRLRLPVEEFNSEPVAGKSTVARLSEMLNSSAFAFLVMTGEDEQSDGKLRARQNVIHEVGLFQGRLGFTRAIVLLEEGCDGFSNIHGLGYISFPRGKVSASFEEIRAVLERESIIQS